MKSAFLSSAFTGFPLFVVRFSTSLSPRPCNRCPADSSCFTRHRHCTYTHYEMTSLYVFSHSSVPRCGQWTPPQKKKNFSIARKARAITRLKRSIYPKDLRELGLLTEIVYMLFTEIGERVLLPECLYSRWVG